MTELSLDFDAGPGGRGAGFHAPRKLFRAQTPEDVPACFEAMERARAQGFWLAGMMSYELGYVFSHRLSDRMPAGRRVPLMLFGAYDAPQPLARTSPPPADEPWPMPPLLPAISRADYGRAFARVKEYIAAGDVYQINLTFPLTGLTDAAPHRLYRALSAGNPVGQGCLLQARGAAGDFALLSRSPELFFGVDGAGLARARPMKGTAARGATPAADRAAAEALRLSEKNRAENLMIVDLLRNDLSRVARPGTVRVPQLFDIETYATLHQMTSTITAELAPGTGFAALMAALFPCGSITGAPKIRAMQIIRDLEPSARDAYCGAIGWVAPVSATNFGAMEFSVAIRTALLRDGRLVLNVGGGIVADSEEQSEWEEALCKAAFATTPPRG